MHVNGETSFIGQKADPEVDEITVDGRPLALEGQKRYLMLNKPRGYVCTLSDEKGRKTVAELVKDCGARVYPVGRLDLDSEGLLLLTNDGEWMQHLLHPRYEVNKVYEVSVAGEVRGAAETLASMTQLDGEPIRPAQVRVLRQGRDTAVLSITIHEGKNRQIRRSRITRQAPKARAGARAQTRGSSRRRVARSNGAGAPCNKIKVTEDDFMTKNILHNIEKNMSSFSKGQKLIARFILENYDKAAFMTASKLGKTVQVSESTVVRFATQLGYEGYPSMQRALQEMIRGKLTSIQRIQASDGELAGSDLMTNVLQRDMEKIRMAIDQTDGAEFERVVDTIIGARRIYIVGFRSSSFLAGYLNFYFRLIFDNVTLVNGGAAGSFDQLFRVSKDDVVIGICFPRYSELALKTIQFSRDRGATIVGVTDSEMSPINQMSSNSLLVRSEMISFVDSLAAPMSMLNALILAVANKKGADISATFSELEHIWERFDIFGKIEDE